MEQDSKNLKPRDPCKQKACAIQRCLERTRYNVAACKLHYDRLTECCKQYDYKSDACGSERPANKS